MSPHFKRELIASCFHPLSGDTALLADCVTGSFGVGTGVVSITVFFSASMVGWMVLAATGMSMSTTSSGSISTAISDSGMLTVEFAVETVVAETLAEFDGLASEMLCYWESSDLEVRE